ncbi:uncharacterized protein [Procambarus clarkii]|uniref:uncharacterized protein n=1 Tax=Procambarus clarkii TaxID=6728 RepID=UPI001E678C89|nr:uncharacterized protein LOC123763632 [Procambarus clarkii]
MVWVRWAVGVWILAQTCTSTLAQVSDCNSGYLKSRNDATPPLTLEESATIRLRPENYVKVLRLEIQLETTEEEQLYCLGLDANMGKQWGDVEVTLKDIRTSSINFKVSWPPILLPLVWTAVYVRVHYQHLLQLAVIPEETMESARSLTWQPVSMKPLAASVRLERTGVTSLRIRLLTSNISIQYTVNCRQDYLAASFAAEFGIASSVPTWRAWVWILTGVVILLLVLLLLVLLERQYTFNKRFPNSFTLAKFQSGSQNDGVSPVLVSSSQGGRRPAADGAAAGGDSLNPPRVTVGVVSSRAPSPGHDVDENTFDYINRAFSLDG